MSDMLKIAAFAVAAALCAFLLRAMHRQAGAAVALAAGVLLCGAALTAFAPAVETVRALSAQTGVESETGGRLLKMVGVAYIAEFACQTCRDAGEEGLAHKTALCGKMLLLTQTLPLIRQIAQLALALLP